MNTKRQQPIRLITAALALLAAFAVVTACHPARAGVVTPVSRAQANEQLQEVWTDPDDSFIIALIKFALAAGADVNVKDERGVTPLAQAALRGSLDCAQLLVASGADVSAKDARSEPVIDYAINGGSVDCVRFLASKGANVSAADDSGKTPLMYAIASDSDHQDSLDDVKILIAAGANVNAKDDKGNTAMYWAMRNKYPDIVAALKAAGAK